jgi:hypothetical protein
VTECDGALQSLLPAQLLLQPADALRLLFCEWLVLCAFVCVRVCACVCVCSPVCSAAKTPVCSAAKTPVCSAAKSMCVCVAVVAAEWSGWGVPRAVTQE